MKALKVLATLVVPAVVLMACSSTPDKPASTTATSAAKSADDKDATAKPSADSGKAATTPIAAPAESKPETKTAKDAAAALKNVIYFDYDKSEIKAEFRDVVSAHAAFLAKNATSTVTIEGHCDERGTREYNIALGDRRANAVRQMLMLQGVSSKQISTISYGEERPVAMGHDEASWSQNRRAVFIYVNK